MNVIFFGTPDFVVPVADSLLGTKKINIVAVVTNPDRPIGRKQIVTPSPIKKWAIENSISVIAPELLDQNFQDSVRSFQPELGILASYGRIISKEIIDLFPKGIIVIHPSLLPKYRGSTPIPAAILSGDEKTGVSFIQMDERMDHGPIIHQFKSEINPTDTAETLLIRIWKESAEKLPDIINGYLTGKIVPRVQDESRATYTKLFDKEHGFVPFEYLKMAIEGRETNREFPVPSVKNYSAIPNSQFLNNYIRALSPWPGVWSEIEISNKEFGISEKRLKILKAHVEIPKFPNSQIPILVLDIVQLEGKNPQPFPEFTRFHPEIFD